MSEVLLFKSHHRSSFGKNLLQWNIYEVLQEWAKSQSEKNLYFYKNKSGVIIKSFKPEESILWNKFGFIKYNSVSYNHWHVFLYRILLN